MNDIRFSKLIAPAFFPVHSSVRDEAYSEYWLEGGRGSCKSSFVSLQIVKGIVSDPEANAIVYRKVADTLRESVYAQIVWAIGVLGLDHWFRCKISPMEITYKLTGQRILFRGADDPGKSKSIKLAKGYFKYLWFEELTEFDGMDAIITIKASIIRGGGHAMTFYTYNPPKSANNWTNEEAMKRPSGRMRHHSDYTMVPPDWLGPSFLADAEALRETNERAYRHTYLGEITGTGGQVFDNVEVRAISEEERTRFDRFYYGGDFGFASDPDAFLKLHYDKRARTLFFLAEIYGIRMNADTLAQKVKAMAGRDYVTCDSEDPRMIGELKRRGINALPARKGPGSVDHGMRWLQDLGKIVIDPATCPNAAREFSGYEYEQDRFGNFLSRYPDKDNHTIDGARYAMESVANQRIAKILNKDTIGIF